MLVVKCLYFFLVFFFFKQKTAYEMRISDWSSDVCSSDLRTDQVPETYPRLASLLDFVPLDEVIVCADAVMAVQRDHGDRRDRQLECYTYTIDATGFELLKAEIEPRLVAPFGEEVNFAFAPNGTVSVVWFVGSEASQYVR